MPKVFFVNEQREIEVPVGANLRREALKAGIQVYKGLFRWINCFGHGTCGTCRVLVKKGMENLSPKGKLERFTIGRMIASIGREDEMRLSCQCTVNGDCTIETKPGIQVSPEKDAKGKYFWETPYPNK
jgi:2Fe-2S ferredoxin